MAAHTRPGWGPFSEDGDDFMHKLQIMKKAGCYLFKVALLFVLRLCPSFILLPITQLLFSKNMKFPDSGAEGGRLPKQFYHKKPRKICKF